MDQATKLQTQEIQYPEMGIKKYQKQKRVRYMVSGKVDMPGTVYVVLVYSNRALVVQGRTIKVTNT